jgi:hypothetical protein
VLFFLGELVEQPITVYCDNSAAVSVANSISLSGRTKHIAVAAHFVREQIAKRVVKVLSVPTRLNVSDFLTKALAKEQFHFLIKRVGIDRC